MILRIYSFMFYIEGQKPERPYMGSTEEYDAAMKEHELYLAKLKRKEDLRREREQRALDVKERQDRFQAEQKSIEKKIEYETKNKFFLTLATLSAASVTLLVQFVSGSEVLVDYSESGKTALKFALMFFVVTLIFCIVHNFSGSKNIFQMRPKDVKEQVIFGLVAVVSYILGIGTLAITVMRSF
jgi:hypothetical protein